LQTDVPAWHGTTIGLYAIPVIYCARDKD
jgi:hypothetical protein